MTDSIIERAANAVANELLRQEPAKGGTFFVDVEDLSSARVDGDFDLRHVARAVLQAIREPSDAMKADASPELASVGNWGDAGGPAPLEEYQGSATAVWQAMIDAALAET